MENYTSELAYKMSLRKLLSSLKTNKPYNLFCHQVSPSKVDNVNETIKKINEQGLKCSYETTSRTITFMGDTQNYSVDKIANYFYEVDMKNLTSNVILFAIPKMVKTEKGTFDYSTPIGIVGDNNIDAKHSIMDHTFNGVIDKEFILATLYIDKGKHHYSISKNDNHMLRNNKREKKLNEIRNRIINYTDQNKQTTIQEEKEFFKKA